MDLSFDNFRENRKNLLTEIHTIHNNYQITKEIIINSWNYYISNSSYLQNYYNDFEKFDINIIKNNNIIYNNYIYPYLVSLENIIKKNTNNIIGLQFVISSNNTNLESFLFCFYFHDNKINIIEKVCDPKTINIIKDIYSIPTNKQFLDIQFSIIEH